ncbi:uncharacterized protein LOC117646922 [Thrips palmi]|uniref:Uncharacterized protein LOC117646922 n=1 Tax=Thrips palmi TaxID=161013 RepID=A0A6P8ZPI8_THRPL|nr:uncharacterized protein LOC117646922 [Thrips palmi]
MSSIFRQHASAKLHMRFWALLLFFTGADIHTGEAKSQPRAALRYHAIEGCKGVQTPFKVLNSSISRTKQGVYFISVDFYNHKVMKTITKMELSLTKCADAVSYNTCEYDGTHKFTVGLCQLLTSPTMPWASTMNRLQPPLRCPLQAGPYTIKNATVDMTAVMKAAGPGVIQTTFGNVNMADVKCFNEKNEVHLSENVRTTEPGSLSPAELAKQPLPTPRNRRSRSGDGHYACLGLPPDFHCDKH